jgi:NAD(P)-dependent dehydrogenase (short-subunit alcohol dehydrogenase family)
VIGLELKGKTAFITGGGGGIGGGMAEAFAEQGMKVVVADIDLAAAQDQAEKLECEALALKIDVTSRDSWTSAKAEACEKFGQVDVLCNNAGISVAWKPLVDMEPETFDRAMQINLYGVFNGVKCFGPDMVARGYGHICNTSSLNGLICMGTMGTYSASKFAVTALTDALRDEMLPHGVGVSALYPGLTRSKMSLSISPGGDLNTQSAEAREALKSMVMMDPIWLGRAVVRAIGDGRHHIISHPSAKPSLEAWFKEILDSFGEPADPDYKG